MKSSLSTVALTLLLSANDSTVSAFLPNPSLPSSVVRPFATPKLSPLQAGKGFGSNSPEEPKKKSASPSAATPAEKPSGVVASQQQQQQQLQSPPLQSTELNPGQKALEEIRRARAEKKDAELRKVRELVQTDQQVQETPAVIPEKVAQRMGKRMLPFVGIPLLGSMSAFVAFWYLAVYKNMEFQPMAVAASTIAILVFSLVGITYSVMSASWDPDREGDILGGEEFSRNLDSIKGGLSRSRENAILRDKMSELTGEELDKAIQELNRKEAAESKRAQSLSNKLQDELD